MEFKTIERAPRFEINTQGDVRNKETQHIYKWRTATPKPSRLNYEEMNVPASKGRNSKHTKLYKHTELARAFIPNPDNLPVVMHLDGNHHNNGLSNLAWGSQEQNMRQASDVDGSYDDQKVSLRLRDPEGTIHNVFGIRHFAKLHNIDWGNLGKMRKGKAKSVKGWTLVDEVA
ncbi:hypothetical protein AB4379_12160 [Vibrio breoganii]